MVILHTYSHSCVAIGINSCARQLLVVEYSLCPATPLLHSLSREGVFAGCHGWASCVGRLALCFKFVNFCCHWRSRE